MGNAAAGMETDVVARAKANLARALKIEGTARLPDAGWRWQAYRMATLRFVNYFRTPIEVIHAVQSPRSNMGYEARMSGRTLVDYARGGEQACLGIFPQYAAELGSFRESPLSHPDTLALMNGRLVSSPMYSHAIHIMRCASLVKPGVVLEIGGGYGAPGRLWTTNRVCRPRIYVDVDFPESLFFAEVYLRSNDPSLRVEYLTAEADIERIHEEPVEGPTVVLAPIALIESLKSLPVDLVVNTGSLQEMTPEWVEFYCGWLDRIRAGHFYSSNYFGQRIDNLLEGMNFVAPDLSERWASMFRSLHVDPLRPVAEMLFRRIAEDEIPAQRERARARCTAALAEPIDLRLFLEMFDLSRFVGEPALLDRICGRAMEMVSVPKEALPLAKRLVQACRASPGGAALAGKARSALESLTRMADAGRPSMGIVDPTVEKFRNVLMGDAAAMAASSGNLVETTEGTTVEIAGSARAVRQGTCGAVERKALERNQMTIAGWARGKGDADAVTSIHVFLDGRLVESAAPDIPRRDLGIGPLKSGFEIKSILPMDQADAKHCFVVAEFSDGTLGKLANGGDIG